jgi:hypothetical protein
MWLPVKRRTLMAFSSITTLCSLGQWQLTESNVLLITIILKKCSRSQYNTNLVHRLCLVHVTNKALWHNKIFCCQLMIRWSQDLKLSQQPSRFYFSVPGSFSTQEYFLLNYKHLTKHHILKKIWLNAMDSYKNCCQMSIWILNPWPFKYKILSLTIIQPYFL